MFIILYRATGYMLTIGLQSLGREKKFNKRKSNYCHYCGEIH